MKKIIVGIIVIIFLSMGILVWWNHQLSPVNTADTANKEFVVTKGESVRDVATDLQNQGLIRSGTVFVAYVKSWTFRGSVQAGTFFFSPSLSTPEIAEKLSHGTTDIQVTIPEGKRATEIAIALQNKLTNYDDTWKTKLVEQEGYLFPDTYSLAPDSTLDQVLSKLTKNFDTKYTQASNGQTSKLSKNETVILASILEREGKSVDDMKMIASVLINRLNLGMALQVDASVQYAIGNSFNWWPTPSAQDLAVNSPYNTYLNPGLPPTPICNPGLNALTAALHPAVSNYLYYFTDKTGVTHFSRTLDEQNANIRRYGI